jgi:hypothetical protein
MGRLGELKQRTHFLLAAGLASESKLDSIPSQSTIFTAS